MWVGERNIAIGIDYFLQLRVSNVESVVAIVLGDLRSVHIYFTKYKYNTV